MSQQHNSYKLQRKEKDGKKEKRKNVKNEQEKNWKVLSFMYD